MSVYSKIDAYVMLAETDPATRQKRVKALKERIQKVKFIIHNKTGSEKAKYVNRLHGLQKQLMNLQFGMNKSRKTNSLTQKSGQKKQQPQTTTGVKPAGAPSMLG